MSDSSEGEDMTRFREAVDNSFVNNFIKSKGRPDSKVSPKLQKSERYLEESGHYNDLTVPAVVQRQIAEKVSSLIEKKIKFVDVDVTELSAVPVEGGVRLFTDSGALLSAEEPRDTYTAAHNRRSRALRRPAGDDEYAKARSVAVSGAAVAAGADTALWSSRRKEKVFRYKSKKRGTLLTAVD